MNHSHRLRRNPIVDGRRQVADDEVIHVSNSRLGVGRVDLGTGDEGDTQLLGSRSRVVGVGVIIGQDVVAHGTHHAGVVHHFGAFFVSGFRGRRHIFQNKVAGRDGRVVVIVGTLGAIVEQGAVGRLVPEVVGRI